MAILPPNDPFSLGNFIGSSMLALVQGQSMVSHTNADLVRELGFETAPDGTPTARSFPFRFTREELDEASGEVTQREVTVELPLLTVVPLPALALDEAVMEFDLQVNAEPGTSTEGPDRSLLSLRIQRPATSDTGTTAATGAFLETAASEAEATALPGPTLPPPPPPPVQTANMKFRLTVKSVPNPVGMDQLIQLLSSGGRERPNPTDPTPLRPTHPAPVLLTGTLPAGVVQERYEARLEARAGTRPYRFAAADLPAGLALDPETGVISGIPLRAGTHEVEIAVIDGAGLRDDLRLPLRIAAVLRVRPGTASLAGGALPFTVELATGGAAIAGAQLDLLYASRAMRLGAVAGPVVGAARKRLHTAFYADLDATRLVITARNNSHLADGVIATGTLTPQGALPAPGSRFEIAISLPKLVDLDGNVIEVVGRGLTLPTTATGMIIPAPRHSYQLPAPVLVLGTPRGDLDQDGTVDVVDLQRLARMISKLDPVRLPSADVNGDTRLSVADFNILLKQVLSRG